MGLIAGWVVTTFVFAGYAVLARQSKFTWKQNVGALSRFLIFGAVFGIAQSLGLLNVVGGMYIAVMARMYWLLGDRWKNTRIRSSTDQCSLGVFMGSGGHTAEMKALASSLDFKRYTPRTYVYCHGDQMSSRIISELESSFNPSDHTILALPRARKVGEGRISTLFSATKTLLFTIWHILLVPLFRTPMKPWVDVLILNGPGTAVILVAVSWVRRFVGLPWTQIIYVESFARTNSLSLSGKILRGFVDVFVVQWPEAAGPNSTASVQGREVSAGGRDQKVVHRGWLV